MINDEESLNDKRIYWRDESDIFPSIDSNVLLLLILMHYWQCVLLTLMQYWRVCKYCVCILARRRVNVCVVMACCNIQMTDTMADILFITPPNDIIVLTNILFHYNQTMILYNIMCGLLANMMTKRQWPWRM